MSLSRPLRPGLAGDMVDVYMTLVSKSRLRALRGLRDGLPSIYIHTYIHVSENSECENKKLIKFTIAYTGVRSLPWR